MERAGWSYPPGDVRVSDADRDRALSELSEAFQTGRITPDEFEQRSGQALTARTGNELTALLADLPVQHAPAPRTSAPTSHQRVVATRVAVAASIAAVCFAAAAATAALDPGPSLAQQEFMRRMAAQEGLPVPPLAPRPGFDWPGTLTPAVIAALLAVLVAVLLVVLRRARPAPTGASPPAAGPRAPK